MNSQGILPGLPGGSPWSPAKRISKVVMPRDELLLPPKVAAQLRAEQAITHRFQRVIDARRWGLPYWEVRR